MEQLSLFTKRKAAKMKPAPEMALHCMVADTLRISAAPGWLWWHTPNGGWRTAAEAGKFKRMGVRPGVSDFILIEPGRASVHALEIKAKGQKLTDEQALFLLKVRQAGGWGSWADSYEAALVILKEWGAVTDRLHIEV